ncbi:MAG: hypothetical protein EXR62_10815 [Chloroflexi bacterium]|nr:hypothetical protein [Chloroflexota bacterium]
MLSEFRKRKLNRLLVVNDSRGKGFIEKADYELIFERLAKNMEWAPGTEAHDMMHAAVLQGWEGLVLMADANKDGRVTYEEFLQATEAIIGQKELFDQFVMGQVEMGLIQADKNRDGQITITEFIAYLTSYNITADEATLAFYHLDRNGDGFLTRDEMMQNAVDFFTSDDPAAPGNWLVGPV